MNASLLIRTTADLAAFSAGIVQQRREARNEQTLALMAEDIAANCPVPNHLQVRRIVAEELFQALITDRAGMQPALDNAFTRGEQRKLTGAPLTNFGALS